jgi:predicted short-subunit dehydrogenase-like oxidoreductase (DUF2520 family)
MKRTLSIIGAGRVGRVLAERLRERGWKISAVVARTESSARKAVRLIGAGHAHATVTGGVLLSSLILICTPDSAIGEVTAKLARLGSEALDGKVVLHTSGALSADVLAPLRQYGASVGALHPLQTFTGVGMPTLEGRIFTIDGDPVAIRVARQIARDLGGLPVRISGAAKAAYHAAATMSCAQVLALVEAATQLLMSIGMKRREAVRAIVPLTRQMLQNFERLGPKAAWTGALSRGDFDVIQAHTAALQNSPAEYRDAYAALNRLAARVLAQNPDEVLALLHRPQETKTLKARASGGSS